MKINLRQDGEGKELEVAFKEFIKYCRVKNLSLRTIDYYDECYSEFIKFFGENRYTYDITSNVIDDYVLFLKSNTNFNSVSINTRLRGIRVIIYYFQRINYVKEFKIGLLKAEKKIKQTYSDAELTLLLKKPDIKKCSFSEYRDWVIINYLLSTGNRASTIINVKIKDVDFNNGIILLQKTKNNKQQIIPLSRTLSQILMEYLEYRKGTSEDYIFCSAYGQKLNVNSLEHSISKYNQRRGITKTSIHLFRHTFAKKWILAGGDIFRLQKILGHSSLDVVKEYVYMFSNDLQKDFDKFNALEQITKRGNMIAMR